MTPSTRRLAPLLFCSGMCALIYQVAWFRELRLVFGASTAASAAVLAIFMGGLGAGGLVLGERADAPAAALALRRLEMLVAILAAHHAAAPLARSARLRCSGRHPRLGLSAALRSGSSCRRWCCGAPTLLMGGTLPAAARGVEARRRSRRGAIPACSTASTRWARSLARARRRSCCSRYSAREPTAVDRLRRQLLVALVARASVGALGPCAAGGDALRRSRRRRAATVAAAPAWFVWPPPAIVGFAFLLMELVWYRMLGPLLGGTVVHLRPHPRGRAARHRARRRAPTRSLGEAAAPRCSALPLTCALEALCLAVPFALGDRLAVLALAAAPARRARLRRPRRRLDGRSRAIVVLPAAFVSGVQFPLLIALLGRGRARVGTARRPRLRVEHRGRHRRLARRRLRPAAAADRAGLLARGGVAARRARARGRAPRASRPRRPSRARPVLAVSASVALCCSCAPRAPRPRGATAPSARARRRRSTSSDDRATRLDERRAAHDSLGGRRRREQRRADATPTGWAFIVNGKIDGNARGDAATQVMGGLLGALLHRNPKRALVIGLGTG